MRDDADSVAPPPPIGGLRLRALHKRHPGASAPALDIPALDVPGGQLVALLGPSGCGKSTLLRLIAGLEPAGDGEIWLDGRSIGAVPASERGIGLVFQDYALFPHLDVFGNVVYGPRAAGVAHDPARQAAVDALELLGIGELAARPVAQLSGGQQQRVAIARALAAAPRVLLLDEPLSNLDPPLRRQVREEIRALQRRLGLTVVYATHDVSEAMAVSDRVVVLRGGRLVQVGAPRAIYEQPADEFVAGFIGDGAFIEVPIDAGGVAWVGPLPCAGLPAARGPARARLAIRPHAWEVHPPSESGLAAIVLRSSYVGAMQELRLLTDLGEFLAFCGLPLYLGGAPVTLRLRARGVALIGAPFRSLSTPDRVSPMAGAARG